MKQLRRPIRGDGQPQDMTTAWYIEVIRENWRIADELRSCGEGDATVGRFGRLPDTTIVHRLREASKGQSSMNEVVLHEGSWAVETLDNHDLLDRRAFLLSLVPFSTTGLKLLERLG